MASDRKQETITFKVDPSLVEALKDIPNRSAFIRNALLSAVGRRCPLCQGSGMLSEDQQRHLEQFRRTHTIRECEECHAVYVACDNADEIAGGRGGQRNDS